MCEKELCMPHFSSVLEQNEMESQSINYLKSNISASLPIDLQDEKEVEECLRDAQGSFANGRYSSNEWMREETESEVKTILQGAPERNDASTDLYDACMFCTKYELVQDANTLQMGDTIRLKRAHGLYYHCATVVDVENISSDGKSATLNLVELKKDSFPFQTNIQITEKPYDFSKNKIQKAVYTSRRFTRQEIVERALKEADDFKKPKTYNVAHKNCEHHSNNIAQGKMISQQADSAFCKIKSVLSFIFKSGCKFVAHFARMPGILKYFGPVGMSIAAGFIIHEIIQTKNLLKKGTICLCCYDVKYLQLKISLGLIIVGLGIALATGFHIATVATIVPLGLILPFAVPFAYKKIMQKLRPEFGIPKILVKSFQMVKPGDVLTFNYGCRRRQGIVTAMQNCTEDEAKVKLTVVHFPLRLTYTVENEEMFFDLNKKQVFVIDFSETEHNSAEEVVQMAKDKCGSKNHSHLSYRSSHMARECKTGRKKLEKLPQKRAKALGDISPGDIINFRYCLLPHEAVVVKVEYVQKMKCSLVQYNKKGVVEEDVEIDLSEQNVFVHQYPPNTIYNASEVIKRAKSKIGEKKLKFKDLVKWCKVQEKKENSGDKNLAHDK